MNVNTGDTVRSLKDKVLEKLKVFQNEDLYLQILGKPLYDMDSILYEFSIKDGNTISILELDKEFGISIELDLLQRHTQKTQKVKQLFPDEDEAFLMYVMKQNADKIENAIGDLSTSMKDYYLKKFEVIKQIKLSVPQSNRGFSNRISSNSKNKNYFDVITKLLSSDQEFYDTLLKIVNSPSPDIFKPTFDLLANIPINSQLRDEIQAAFFSEIGSQQNQDGFELRNKILQNPCTNRSQFYFIVLGNILEDMIRDKKIEELMEFFVSQGASLFSQCIMSETQQSILTKFYQIMQREHAADYIIWRDEDKLLMSQVYSIIPIFRCLHIILDISIDSGDYNSPSIQIKNDKINTLKLESMLNHPIVPISIGMSILSDTSVHFIQEETFMTGVKYFFEQLVEGLVRNVFSFPGDKKIQELLSSIILFFIKNQIALEKNKKDQNFDFFDLLVKGYQTATHKSPKALLGNCVFLVIGYFPEKGEALLQKLFDEIVEFSFFEEVPENTYQGCIVMMKAYSIHQKAKIEQIKRDIFKGEENSEQKLDALKKEIKEKLIGMLEKLPNTSLVNDENLSKVEPDNFEGILSINKQLFTSITECEIQVSKEKLGLFFEEIIMPNIKGLFNEEDHLFKRCIAHGSDNLLKNQFFETCIEFSKVEVSFGLKIFEFLTSVYEESDFSDREFQWVDIRKGDEPIGLKNLGCTCYINSLMQMLYNNDVIKTALMRSLPSNEIESQLVLFEVKKAFWGLMYSRMDAVILESFCKVFTGFDGMPINPRVQQDANEFFNLLIDVLQRQWKESLITSGQENILVEQGGVDREGDTLKQKDYFDLEFGGKMVSVIESLEDEYPYRKERPESFLTVPLTIKNIDNMNDALDEFCQKEYFRDDNKLRIDEYDQKIEVSKRSFFKNLPPTMIFTLNRFEYDMTTWARIKLDTFFEFPFEIDLSPWCLRDSEDNRKLDCIYQLKGVLIHSGTAEAGHYYSYIKKDEKWIEFNDTTVRDFDPTEENLIREWYGHKDTPQNAGSFYTSNTSAYMLFYSKKCEGNKVEEISEEKEGEDWQKLKNEIEIENKIFLRSKIFMDSVSLRFLDDLLENLNENNDESVDKVAQLFMNEERTEITNQKVLMILKKRNVRNQLI